MPSHDPISLSYMKAFGVPIVTFVAGFLTSRFTMSKKERADVSQTAFANTRELMERQEQTYQAYAKTINQYIEGNSAEDFTNFALISSVGETYFYQLKIACDAILSGHVDHFARDNTLLPKIREATLRSLPAHYDALQDIARKQGFRYDGVLRRENYESLYTVLEKYGESAPWQG